MGKIIHISVRDRAALYSARDGSVVCGNDDYQIQFTLDSEWDGLPAKARFKWNGKHQDVLIVDGLAAVPRITNAREVQVGVYSEDGSLQTTTAALIPCDKSILCDSTAPTEGNEAYYASEAQKAAERAEEAAERAASGGGTSGGGTGGGGVVIDPESVNQAQEAAQRAEAAQEAAADFAQAAGQSAEEAETSKNQATAAQEAAAEYATEAANAEQTAITAADIATGAQAAAETAQGKAEGARDTAIANAEAASASATAAAREAGNASKSATAAATDRTAAESARDEAAQKAADATTAAQTATSKASAATAANSAAQTAQTAAEAAQTAASNAATAAQTAQGTAEEAAARAEALAQKVENGELKGEPGKSAYQYAVAGGFAGTEADFAKKLAAESPTALPNPKKLIINGVEYDGAKEVSLQLDDVEIVESVEDMTDTTKYYALKNDAGNGDIWWYVYHEGHTNWLPIAYESYDPAPTDDSVPPPLPLKNGEPDDETALRTGYRMNWRVDGKNGEEETSPDGLSYLTGYIPVHAGSVVTCKNIKMDSATYGCLAAFYDENGAILKSKHVSYGGDYIVDNEHNGITITVPPAYTTAAYIRIQGYYEYRKTPELNTAIIVVDETIKDYETGYQWEDSGINTSLGNDTALLELTKQVNAIEEMVKSGSIAGGSVTDYGLPDYWTTHLDEKIAQIKEHITAAGRNAVAYIVMSDLHIDAQRALYTGKLSRRIMDECGISTAIDLGDHTSRGYIASMEESEEQFDKCDALLAPIAAETLRTPGNHDGTVVVDSSTTVYYDPADVLDRVYGGMRTDRPIVWDGAGSGYYCDDRAHRVRYIVLNTSSRGDFTGDLGANGGYTHFRYTQYQYDLVKEALTSLPNDRWRVVVASHVPPVASVDRFGDGLSVSNLSGRFGDAPQMRKLLAAYANRGTVSINYADTSFPYGTAQLTADFSAAKGRLLLYHAGHFHVDLLWPAGSVCDTAAGDQLALPIVGHRCDSFNETQGSGSSVEAALVAERVAGTITEHSFDVVVIDPDNDTAHLVKIGAGQDRTVSLT